MLHTLSALWILLFPGLLLANEPTEKPAIKIHWLPFVPALYGLLAGAILFFIGVGPIGLLLSLPFPSASGYLSMAMVFSTIGLISYWAPIAYPIRKIAGEKFTIVL